LELFVGEAYTHGSFALQIIAAFFALTLLGDALGNILLLLSETGKASAVTAAGVAVSLSTAFFLLPWFGIAGAAASRGVGMLVSFALTLALARPRISLSFDREALWKSLSASVGMAVVVLLVQQVCYSRLLFPVYAGLGAITYLAGLRLLRAIRQADVELARQLLGRRHEKSIDTLSRILKASPYR
jgi:O-antigen/teichoic acid export membrane protein